MRIILAVLFLLTTTVCGFSQRVATLATSSDLKTVKNGFIETQFTLDQALSDAEIKTIREWSDANQPYLTVSVNDAGTGFSLKVTPEYNQQGIYEKTFYQLNIGKIQIEKNGSVEVLGNTAFFAKFNLQ